MQCQFFRAAFLRKANLKIGFSWFFFFFLEAPLFHRSFDLTASYIFYRWSKHILQFVLERVILTRWIAISHSQDKKKESHPSSYFRPQLNVAAFKTSDKILVIMALMHHPHFRFMFKGWFFNLSFLFINFFVAGECTKENRDT